jgi:acetyl-CoA C-acetyltransferase
MMGETAENLAEIHSISLEEQDEYAVLSHKRAVTAMERGYFDSQIVPLTVKERKGEKIIEKDESPRAGLKIGKLQNLKPAFQEGGSVTAGNSSSLNDGGAALILMSEEEAERRGLQPLGRIVGYSVAGVDPKVMGIGPVPAIQKGLHTTDN